MCNFKLLAFSADRGPLAYPGLTPWQWLLLLLLPYFPLKKGHTAARAHHIVLAIAAKVALAAGLTVFLNSPAGHAHLTLRHAGYAAYIWLFASLILDLPLPLGGRLLNHMPLQPAMNNPFASTSVREFWGHRYNQIVSSILQETVFLPMLEGRWVAERPRALERKGSDSAASSTGPPDPGPPLDPYTPPSPADAFDRDAPAANGAASAAGPDAGLRRRKAPPGAAFVAAEGEAGAMGAADGGLAGAVPRAAGRPLRGRRLLAMVAAFAVSGVMHEVCIGYMCHFRLEGSWRMLLFFLVQPLIILAQEAATAVLLPAGLKRRLAAARRRERELEAGEEQGTLTTALAGSGGKAAPTEHPDWVVAVVRLVQRVLTLLLVLGSADLLFWSPFETCGIDVRGLGEFSALLAAVQALPARVAGLLH
ncbi:hypothetical protein HYH03_005579 [Edaphochlamys debaryana]|uniref:Wax synthase domain-containing protein n=1 Tax=Edaphochlamys debaryana TaxID=47281 RepID=A0A835Y734_9CHLO|nr:hypothetical protein HYH03_005579 [Edaphochlamys debaryana]|eukprot:KAG2496349.1 hypothetical protein HYH03_005579 [Edaphochlamys debaryana]